MFSICTKSCKYMEIFTLSENYFVAQHALLFLIGVGVSEWVGGGGGSSVSSNKSFMEKSSSAIN